MSCSHHSDDTPPSAGELLRIIHSALALDRRRPHQPQIVGRAREGLRALGLRANDVVMFYRRLKPENLCKPAKRNWDYPHVVWECHFKAQYDGETIYSHCHVNEDNILVVSSFKRDGS